MSLIARLDQVWAGRDEPFLISDGTNLRFSDIRTESQSALHEVSRGDVVAIIGDFNPSSIFSLLTLIDRGAIVVPLTKATASDHEYFFESSLTNVVVDSGTVIRRMRQQPHPLLDEIRGTGSAGLILFSTGTTGRPKAILHNFTPFLARFETPRPPLRTMGFLLFDHIGGLNTLFHAMFNGGVVVSPESRSVDAVLRACAIHQLEVLPTTPTFLRMMLMSGLLPDSVPDSLKIITYGTERMDQPTLEAISNLLPSVDFRQTYGMSEIGILRVKSEARNSLYMKVGGEGVTTRIVDNELQIHSESRMLGYLNAPSPFDSEGWYRTGDLVEEKGDYLKVVGRLTETINVGGLKFTAGEVERAAMSLRDVYLSKAVGKSNPVTGQHVELFVELRPGSHMDSRSIADELRALLPRHMVPMRVILGTLQVGHRFKRT